MPGILENRVYLNTSETDEDKKLTGQEIHKAIMGAFTLNGKKFKAEQAGAGIRSYGDRWGSILAFFRFCSEIKNQ